MRIIAIIPAAGLGTRMSAAHASKPSSNSSPAPSKQFYELDGVPILIHTLRRFAHCKQVDSIVVALRKNEIAPFQLRLDKETYAAKIELVEGGENRQESVTRALAHVAKTADPSDVVLVHDGVRPFVTGETIHGVIKAAADHGAAIAGIPAVDTVKQVERTADGAIITSTIPRERVVMAQTPQGFRFDVLKKAFDSAIADGFTGTDEASLAERIGYTVHVVMGSPQNIKITTPADMELADWIVKNLKP